MIIMAAVGNRRGNRCGNRRGNYIKKVQAADLKKKVRVAYDTNGDWQSLVDGLGIKKSTAYQWVTKRDEPEKQHGGLQCSKSGAEHEAFIEERVENPQITLKQLSALIQQRFNMVVSSECVRQHLNGLLSTSKKLTVSWRMRIVISSKTTINRRSMVNS